MYLIGFDKSDVAIEFGIGSADHDGPEAVDLPLAMELGVSEPTGFQHI